LKLDLGEKINRRIADLGLSEDSGMGVGKTILQNIKDGFSGTTCTTMQWRLLLLQRTLA